MKWPAMSYARVESLAELWRVMDEAGPEAQILAGGQSLLATLSFTVVAPNTTINLANGKKIRLLNWTRAVTSSQFRF